MTTEEEVPVTTPKEGGEKRPFLTKRSVAFAIVVAVIVSAVVGDGIVEWRVVSVLSLLAVLGAAVRARQTSQSKIKDLNARLDAALLLEKEQFARYVRTLRESTLGGSDIGIAILKKRIRDLEAELSKRS